MNHNSLKILFAVPPRPVVAGREVSASNKSPHIGLAYIAAYMAARGGRVTVMDADAEDLSPDAIRRRIAEFAPDILGVNAYTSDIRRAHELARLAKEVRPAVRTVIGGYHATALSEQTLEEFPSFDFAVAGEGEIAFAALMDAIAKGGGFEAVAGLSFRDAAAVRAVPPGPTIADLDALPRPAFEMFPLDRYVAFFGRRERILELPVSTARGCPFRCVFCANVMPGGVRTRDTAHVIEEIGVLHEKFKMRQVFLVDESFTLNPRRVAEFCERLVAAGLHKKIGWVASSRVDVPRETFFQMRAAGCTHLLFGIESGSREILDKIKKGIAPEQARDAVRWCREAGIATDGNFILGLPHDTEKTIRETIRFAVGLQLDYASFFLLVPYPGSEAYRMAKAGEAGLRLLSEDWDRYGKHMGGAAELEGVPRKRLERLQLEAYLRFYLRFGKWRVALNKVSLQRVFTYLLFQAGRFFK